MKQKRQENNKRQQDKYKITEKIKSKNKETKRKTTGTYKQQDKK